MEKIKINLNNNVKGLLFLDVINISNYDDENFLITLKNKISDITNSQEINYIRTIQKTDGTYETIIEHSKIVKIVDNKNIIISKPIIKLYDIDTILYIDDTTCKIKLTENHNIFQQDIEESKQELLIYDKNYKLISTYDSNNFSIPMRYEDRKVNEDDCYIKSMELKGCSNSCENNKLNVYNYYFLPSNSSRTDLLVNEKLNKLSNAKYALFKYSHFIYGDDDFKFYSDIWGKNVIKKEDDCNVYYINNDSSSKIAINNSYYKLDLSFNNDIDYLKIGSEDSLGSSYINDIEQSLIPNFIDMERIKYIPCSKILNTDIGDDKYLIWNTVRGNSACDDHINVYTKGIPKLYEDNDIKDVYIIDDDGELKIDNSSNIKTYRFGYETGPFFENGIMPTIYKYYNSQESCKYYLTNNILDKNDISITGLSFYLHFIERKKVDYNTRHLNSIYTSGNVYYDTWHIDEDNKENTWWNGFNYNESEFNSDKFTTFNKDSGMTSDLIGYLNFTDSDVFNQKKKVSQSFLRLSFYSSKDPIEQKLLYYSTIFLDGGELYGKYIKQLNYLKRNGILNGAYDELYENTLVTLYFGDRNNDKEGSRVDTKITVTNEYDRTKSSEGFNLYLFSEDKIFESENGEKTIYMKVEFNHAGNGKTIPLIMWPIADKRTCKICGNYTGADKCECGSDEFYEIGHFIPLTTKNYIDSLYIEVKISYVNGRYVYYIPRAIEKDYNLNLVLYEPKLDMLKDKQI